MKFWQGYTVLSLLDAGWVLAMALICISTFVVSSIFARRTSHNEDRQESL
jgi:hypothetical protein